MQQRGYFPDSNTFIANSLTLLSNTLLRLALASRLNKSLSLVILRLRLVRLFHDQVEPKQDHFLSCLVNSSCAFPRLFTRLLNSRVSSPVRTKETLFRSKHPALVRFPPPDFQPALKRHPFGFSILASTSASSPYDSQSGSLLASSRKTYIHSPHALTDYYSISLGLELPASFFSFSPPPSPRPSPDLLCESFSWGAFHLYICIYAQQVTSPLTHHSQPLWRTPPPLGPTPQPSPN